ncbi:hypothetical protein NSU_0987 [Novosphingobium pentaromativorans US6-1]|uniref:Uncharacterized protein n=1 Tax=Novosphingobium pentaromativorans US6-1 TaxID=1088721 RepID=G6E9G6_9SPHN|nr:hypothetical protein NSU_0987 [Novosphingobium pentaromativorans US6-1]
MAAIKAAAFDPLMVIQQSNLHFQLPLVCFSTLDAQDWTSLPLTE